MLEKGYSLGSEPSLVEESETNISNPLQHKGKERPTNKRFLSAIENGSNNQGEISESLKKRNKWQCSMFKSWYHDSRNCSLKNWNNIEQDFQIDKENHDWDETIRI